MQDINPVKPSAEQRQSWYSASLDSVDAINRPKEGWSSETEWRNTVDRNVQHLEFMVQWPHWAGEDLKPFHDAIKAGKAALSAG